VRAYGGAARQCLQEASRQFVMAKVRTSLLNDVMHVLCMPSVCLIRSLCMCCLCSNSACKQTCSSCDVWPVLQALVKMVIPCTVIGTVFKELDKAGAERQVEEYGENGSLTLQVAVPVEAAAQLIDLVRNATAGKVAAARV
jgi:putative IMPACT (imprinted ancient) family translation regulator